MSPALRPVVFLGPTLRVSEAATVLDAEYLAPAQLGDVWRLAQERPPAIGIVDGYFERVPAVWHKEILFALSVGIPVYGAASMGALRGAELSGLGMVPVGAIAEAYRSGVLTADDEVALAHADAEHGYRSLSEPLVNIRATVASAVTAGVISEATGAAIVRDARSMFYVDRDWRLVLGPGTAAPPGELAALRAWLPSGYVDQKRLDAIAMLQEIAARLDRDPGGIPPAPFVTTVLWNELVARETPMADILEEFLLGYPLAPAVGAAVARARAGELVDWFAVLSAEPGWPGACRRARLKAGVRPAPPGPVAVDDLLAWFFGDRLGWPSDLDGFLRARGWTDPAAVINVAAREAAFAAAFRPDG